MYELEVLQSKFKLGDKVCSKKTGLPAHGTVICISEAPLHCYINRVNPNNYPWTELYPDWIDKPVITIKLEEPQKVCSFEEYKHQKYGVPSRDEEKILYKYMVPLSDKFSYPEDDLELLWIEEMH